MLIIIIITTTIVPLCGCVNCMDMRACVCVCVCFFFWYYGNTEGKMLLKRYGGLANRFHLKIYDQN